MWGFRLESFSLLPAASLHHGLFSACVSAFSVRVNVFVFVSSLYNVVLVARVLTQLKSKVVFITSTYSTSVRASSPPTSAPMWRFCLSGDTFHSGEHCSSYLHLNGEHRWMWLCDGVTCDAQSNQLDGYNGTVSL